MTVSDFYEMIVGWDSYHQVYVNTPDGTYPITFYVGYDDGDIVYADTDENDEDDVYDVGNILNDIEDVDRDLDIYFLYEDEDGNETYYEFDGNSYLDEDDDLVLDAYYAD